MNELDELLRATNPASKVETSASEETHEETTQTIETTHTESPSGEITSTAKITFTTIRAVRRRFSTNISDERIGALIEEASAYVVPRVKDCSGQQLEEQIILHTEIARMFQNIMIEHVRLAHESKAPTAITRAEIEELRKKRASEKAARIDKDAKKGIKEKKQAERITASESKPLWETLTRSSDKTQRMAGKTIKSAMDVGVSELAAIKSWNDMMVIGNNPDGIIKNSSGMRMDEALVKSGKGK